MKTIRRTLALVLSMALFLSCIVVNDINVYAATTKVSKVEVTNLKKKSLTILKGKQKVLKVKVTTKDKKISKDFTVKSSNKKVATVKKSGKKVIITAKKKGKANITIASKVDKKKKTVIKVTVGIPVKKVTMSVSNATIEEGKTLQLKAKVSKGASNKKVKWSSSNANVATVNSKGFVTGKQAGTAVITAKAKDGSGKKATCKITVVEPGTPPILVSNIIMEPTSATIAAGSTKQLTATISNNATNKNLIWSSSDKNVATVSNTGLVTAKAAGTAVITALAQDGSGKQATSVITVFTPNSIASFKAVSLNIAEVVLVYPQQLSINNFTMHKKLLDRGNYVSSRDIEYIETKDNKTYIIYLRDSIEYGSFIRVSISGLTGVSGNATKEAVCSEETRLHTSEECVKLICNEESTVTISKSSNLMWVGYVSVTNSALPQGMVVKENKNDTITITGKPSKPGVYKTKFTFTDEIGASEIREVTFIIGDANTISAYINPMYSYTDSCNECHVEDNIEAIGGSGNYKYEIVGNAQELSITSYGYLYGYLSARTCNVSIKVIDKNNENITTTVVWNIDIKQSLRISGKVKNTVGDILPYAEVVFSNVNTDDKYFRNVSYDANSEGEYSLFLPAGTYDVLVWCGDLEVYCGRKTINANQTGLDFVVSICEITINSDNDSISSFSIWYDNDGNRVGSGSTLYLRPGTYSLKSERTSSTVQYTAILNITVTKNEVVTAKVTTQ